MRLEGPTVIEVHVAVLLERVKHMNIELETARREHRYSGEDRGVTASSCITAQHRSLRYGYMDYQPLHAFDLKIDSLMCVTLLS